MTQTTDIMTKTGEITQVIYRRMWGKGSRDGEKGQGRKISEMKVWKKQPTAVFLIAFVFVWQSDTLCVKKLAQKLAFELM